MPNIDWYRMRGTEANKQLLELLGLDMTEEAKIRGLTPELRKMAEEAFGHTGMIDYWEIGDAMIEAFARLVAEDCAKILNEVDNSTDESLSPNKVLCFAGAAIMKKYAP